jgi:AbrB family looped-hinge helix DNA binding protein
VKTTVSSRGQIVLPAEIRRKDHIRSGDELEVQRIRSGEYHLVRVRRRAHGIVDWLLSCPAKGYFVPITSESTDEL